MPSPSTRNANRFRYRFATLGEIGKNFSYIDKTTGDETFVACKELGSTQLIPQGPLSPGDLFTVGFDPGGAVNIRRLWPPKPARRAASETYGRRESQSEAVRFPGKVQRACQAVPLHLGSQPSVEASCRSPGHLSQSKSTHELKEQRPARIQRPKGLMNCREKDESAE